MDDLINMKCEACHAGADLATDEEIEIYLDQLPDWHISLERGEIKQLQKVFKFKNFEDALDFTKAVGKLAEAEGHHPAILTEWGKVTVTYWTHKIRGLHKTDFVMAKKTDALLGDGG